MNTIIIRAVFFMKNDAGEDCAVLVRNITPDGTGSRRRAVRCEAARH